ncbi:transposase family protein [Streptomyces griseofuscus]|uniref:transposase family protein n=1 Tax=Streptomyces griseofuscus TaxID=146922 RepID=UPI0031450181
MIYEVGSSTIGRAISEIRPLLVERGFAIPDRPGPARPGPARPGLRLHTLEDVFAYAAAENITLRIDGTETQVRRPRANRPGRRAFVSGKRRQNTIKTTTISDHQGRTLWSGAMRPGRMHDQTCVRTEGIAEQFRLQPGVKAEGDEGYRGLANEFTDQVGAPPRKPKGVDEAPLTERYGWREQRRRQSSRRICVEHANAEHRQWRTLQRYTGQREDYGDTHRAIAGLVSDRAAKRATRHKPSTELVLVRTTAPGRHGPPPFVGQPVRGVLRLWAHNPPEGGTPTWTSPS